MRHVIRDLYENKSPYPYLKVAFFLNLYRVIAVVIAALQRLLFAPSCVFLSYTGSTLQTSFARIICTTFGALLLQRWPCYKMLT